MASRVAGKIKLQSVDELLGVPEIAGTQEIEIGRISPFPNHPFKVLDDEKMNILVDSIRENGILNPVIVRPDKSGNYEMISGHRRLHERFERTYSQGTMNVTEIWVDKETGVNYLYHAAGYSGGLTPLLDRDGKPVISPIVNG